MDRLSMASALVARAKAHKEWIGDDHGDRYEFAMQTGVVSDEMQIVVKELLDHLRAALDYCAHQVVVRDADKMVIEWPRAVAVMAMRRVSRAAKSVASVGPGGAVSMISRGRGNAGWLCAFLRCYQILRAREANTTTEE
ncbi:hypothetical protein [Rhizobium sp. CECT 9324]|uniref:hypothetical protein n=1 Tax=Rhizobium sp. CECT 9324 TaxID=2845820 RepID=UPI001E593DA3|nr:hypothetical protein [Rhizobium sp. CECT 9324]CAH0343224.1 hypothetical protein RHI9324_04957 [Rhizobium sp. CECT 9324]